MSPSSTTPGTTRAAGRASRRGRLDVTTALAVVLPLVTLAALALVRPDVPGEAARPPTETPLTRGVAICPSGAGEAFLTSAGSGPGGSVDYRLGDREGRARISSGEVTTVSGGQGPFVVGAVGEVAPGLVAGRFDTPLASAECRSPASDLWFTALGSGARHTSVIELVNPDAGPAVVDATLYGASGVIDAPGLRGVAVPGRGLVRLSLAELVPRRDELALRVTTSRGRVTASVRDRVQLLGTGGATEDWLPGQVAPATRNLLLGLAPATRSGRGSGTRTLVLLNPSDSETRATVRVVSRESVFAPAGLEQVLLPPQSVTRVSLTDLLSTKPTEGALGLLVESPAPITATLRDYLGGDLSHAVGGAPISTATSVLAPPGGKQVVLSDASGAGAISVIARTADGEVLAEKRIEVLAGRGYVIEVPAGADLLTVTPERVTVVGAVLVTDRQAAAVVRLRQQVTSGPIASVRPGLP